MRRNHVRYQLFLTPKLAERLEALAVKPGVTKSAILVDALTAWMNAAGASEVEERFGVRLDRISSQMARIERDGQILIEAFALFVHYQLTVCPPIPDGDVAARTSGRGRFNAFVTEVGKAMASGKRALSPTDDTP
jgi:hypothetical protein